MLFHVQDIEYQVRDNTILNKLSLKVKADQPVLLLGSSGCGKTTQLNLMAGLLKANSGDITFDGQSYASLSDSNSDQLRSENFGFVFQKLHLIGHLSVAKNITLAQTKPDHARVQGLISDLGLTGKEKQKARD